MKHSKLSRIVDNQNKSSNSFNAFEQIILNSDRNKNTETPHVNMKYYTPAFECFSTWDSSELKSFSNFISKLRAMKWSEIYKSAGSSGHKTGLGYTTLPKTKYPKNEMLDSVSEDITFFELRIDREMRVHGFRCLDAFYLVYLDKEHRICS